MRINLQFSVSLLLASMFVAGSLCSCSSAEATNIDYVYECKGPNAKVYHKDPECRGLNKCSTSVEKVKESTRRPCRICAKNK